MVSSRWVLILVQAWNQRLRHGITSLPVLWIRIRIRINPDSTRCLAPYPKSHSGSGSRSGSKRAKMPRKNVLHGDLGISKLQFMNQKKKKKNTRYIRCIFLSVFGHQNPGSGSGITWLAGSGSTTLIRAMSLFLQPDIHDPDFLFVLCTTWQHL